MVRYYNPQNLSLCSQQHIVLQAAVIDPSTAGRRGDLLRTLVFSRIVCSMHFYDDFSRRKEARNQQFFVIIIIIILYAAYC
jgi:hypothetical protein